MPNWPRFKVAVAIEVLKTAADEYDEAIADGRIAHAVGYRTARGFFLQAERTIATATSALPAEDAAALGDIRMELARIIAVFASIDAPDRPLIENAALGAAVTQIEAAAVKLLPGR